MNSTVKWIKPDPFPPNNPSWSRTIICVSFFPSFSRPHNRSYFPPNCSKLNSTQLNSFSSPHFTLIHFPPLSSSLNKSNSTTRILNLPPFSLYIHTNSCIYTFLILFINLSSMLESIWASCDFYQSCLIRWLLVAIFIETITLITEMPSRSNVLPRLLLISELPVLSNLSSLPLLPMSVVVLLLLLADHLDPTIPVCFLRFLATLFD